MENFQFTSPSSIDKVVELLDERECTLISGGQSLLLDVRSGERSPSCLVDINDLPDRSYIERDGDKLRIGCLARHTDVATSEIVEDHCQILAEAVHSIGDVQVRNRGTLCGALAQAEPAGDPPVIAAVLDATIVARGRDEKEEFDGEAFVTDPSTTQLDSSQLITEVQFPVIEEPCGASYEKYTPIEVAYPVVSVGSLVKLSNGVIGESRIYTGSIENMPVNRPEAEEFLEGKEPSQKNIERAAELVKEHTTATEDFEGSDEFKLEITQTMAHRSLSTAVERAGGSL